MYQSASSRSLKKTRSVLAVSFSGSRRPRSGLAAGFSITPLKRGRARRHVDVEAASTDPPVAVGRLAVVESQRVDHAVAVEPVVATRRRELRVGPVADEHAVEVGGDLADHLELVVGPLLGDRTEQPFEVRVGGRPGCQSCTTHSSTRNAPRPDGSGEGGGFADAAAVLEGFEVADVGPLLPGCLCRIGERVDAVDAEELGLGA